MKDLFATVALALGVFAIAVWQCGLLEHGWSTPPPVGAGEDWDWQLTQIEVARIAIEAGQWPSWNPFTQGGQPLWANPELSPITALLAVPLGAVVAMKGMVVFHLLLLAVGWSLVAHEHKLSPVAAQVPALFLVGSAFLPEFLMAAHIMFFAVAWLPLAWFALRREKPHWAGLCLAMSLYAGGHYVVLYGAVLLVAVGLVDVVRPWRLRLLAGALLLNGVLFGVEAPWLGWVLLAVFAWTFATPLLMLGEGRPTPLRPLVLALVALSIGALLSAPRWLPLVPLIDVVERLQHGQIGEVADPWTLVGVWDHLVATSRPHHELPNSFYSPFPVLLFAAGTVYACWRRPRLAVVALLFWNLAWAGAGPVNLWEPLQALPGFDQLRTPERLTILWTPLVGLAAALLFDDFRRIHRFATVAPAVAIGAWLAVALPAAEDAQRMGGQAHPEPLDAPFTQIEECTDSNWAHVLRNEGCLNHRSAIALGESPVPAGPLIGATLEGVAFRTTGAMTLPQNFVPGWESRSAEGLVAVSAGGLVRYRPPLLGWSLFLLLLGVLAAAIASRWANSHHRQDATG